MDVYSSFICSCQKLEVTKMPLTGEWINNIHTIKYYSGIKRNEPASHKTQ
jgi:hypothetical protein